MDTGSIVLGAIAGAAVDRLIAVAQRSRNRRNPLYVHIETDPSIIWAGYPPWIGAGYLVPPSAHIGAAPSDHCPDWRNWIQSMGGVDALLTYVKLTLTARSDVTVVVDALRPRIAERRAVPAWRHLQCAVGGASITPRRAEVRFGDFAQPVFSWVDQSGDHVSAPSFSLSGSDVEELHLWAWSDREWISWTADLLLLVDGKRRVIAISDNGRPFVTTGVEGAVSTHSWSSGAWTPPLAQ